MKLVEILAKELSEWPEDVTCMVQDRLGAICTCRNGFPDARDGDWTICGPISMDTAVDWVDIGTIKYALSDDQESATVTCEMWQAERDRQKGGEWKRHRGGDKPKSVSDGEMVAVRLRSGDIQESQADDFIWNHGDCDESANITKYRVISQPQAEEVEVNVRVDSAVNVEYAFGAPDADMSKLDWRVLGACNLDSIEFPTQGEIIHGPISIGDEVIAPAHPKWGQVDGPLLWRDTVNELDAYIEEFTREREAMINRLAEEGFALIEKINLNLDKIDATLDMSDWRNWKAGDIVECVNQNGWKDISEGSQYVLNKHDFFSFVDDVGENRSFAFGEMDEGSVGCDFKFIRRP